MACADILAAALAALAAAPLMGTFAVPEPLRRKGIASYMLREYLSRVDGLGFATRVLLICKEPLVGLYTGAGFENLGPSDVVHGADPWSLMGMGSK